MAALIDAIKVKRKMYFEFENTPYHCLDVEVSTPTARGGQTLVRLKMRNLLTRAVFDKTFKASDKFKEPDLETVPASYLYCEAKAPTSWIRKPSKLSRLTPDMVGDALEFLLEGAIIESQSTMAIPSASSFPRRWNSRSPTPSPVCAATPPAAASQSRQA